VYPLAVDVVRPGDCRSPVTYLRFDSVRSPGGVQLQPTPVLRAVAANLGVLQPLRSSAGFQRI